MEFTDINLKIPKSTDIYFNKTVDPDSVADFNEEFLKSINDYNIEIQKNNAMLNIMGIDVNNIIYQPVNIHLQTYGGVMYNGFSTYNIISNAVGKYPFDINIKCAGTVMSMGIVLLLSVPYENRFAYKDTTFMIHQMSGCLYGKLKDMEEDIEESRRLNKIMFDIILNNTDISREKLETVYKEKIDWFIDAEEALKLKLISKIL